jgi:transcriptional regulator with XRE-family HTH domain
VTDVAARLRTARIQEGLGIEALAARTKINPSFLIALERGAYDELPGDFYARAFLKVYARELHLPADEVVSEYDASRVQAQPADDSLPVEPEAPRLAATMRLSPAIRSVQGTLAPTATLLLVVVMLAMRSRPVEEHARIEGAVGTTGVARAGLVPSAPPPAAAPQKLVVDIRPSGVVWVAASADGKRVLYRLVQPGEHVTVDGAKELTFRIGNAAAFAYAINGVPGKTLGGPDEIREFRITRENFRTFSR